MNELVSMLNSVLFEGDISSVPTIAFSDSSVEFFVTSKRHVSGPPENSIDELCMVRVRAVDRVAACLTKALLKAKDYSVHVYIIGRLTRDINSENDPLYIYADHIEFPVKGSSVF